VYVTDASKLSEPDLNNNIFGSMIIEGERISYRTRNLSANTVSGLRRGVAGTAINSHSAGVSVTNTGIGEQLPSTYQETIYKSTQTGDGSTKVFDINFPANITSNYENVLRVSVGGTELSRSQWSATADGPILITLVDAPLNGEEIEISVLQSKVMYAQGLSTASNGIALQEQTTEAARFIKGLI
jgi:hypothetical protein